MRSTTSDASPLRPFITVAPLTAFESDDSALST
jgi:hypothetical protein